MTCCFAVVRVPLTTDAGEAAWLMETERRLAGMVKLAFTAAITGRRRKRLATSGDVQLQVGDAIFYYNFRRFGVQR